MTDQPPPEVPRWPKVPMLCSAFAAYSALAVLATFPLILNLTSRLPKDLGDPLIAASLLWWNANTMPLTERWWNGIGFFPASGMMAFSEHFLGASLLAAPLQWIGASAVTAYNLTFLASFPLCAMAAHILVLTLTKRHDAALVCGLAFGFNPFRVAHVEHLELLLAFGMPIALTALHRYTDSRRRRWLAVLIAALILQALSSSYYALFFTVFFGLWILWFIRPGAWRDALTVIAAGGVAVLLVWPIATGYAGIHAKYNWRRDLAEEILKFSADGSSFVTASPLSSFWGWTAALNGAERQLFPGLTISALAVMGLVWSARSVNPTRDRWVTLSRILCVSAALFALIAAAASVEGPWQFHQGWLRISLTTSYKPLSVATALAVLALLATATLRDAVRRRSVLGFYLVAAAVLFVCSLGPQPTLLGERILYEPPYAWLMRLPLFGDSVRAPARFAMPGILALSVAASLAFHRVSRPGLRKCALVAVTVGIVFDGWMQDLPLAAVPRAPFAIPAGRHPAAVLELPLGDVWRDTAALYRSTLHGVRTVNGYNGFEPIYYQVLRRGLADRDHTILEALGSFGPILVAIDNAADAGGQWKSFLETHPHLTKLEDGGAWSLYWLPSQSRVTAQRGCAGRSISIIAASHSRGEIDRAALTDRSPGTRWLTPQPPTADDSIVLDLGGEQHPCSLEVSMGTAAVFYPGALEVSTSTDGVRWQTEFAGQMAGAALLAALADPFDARLTVPLRARAARFVRLRAAQSSALYPWAIAGIEVR